MIRLIIVLIYALTPVLNLLPSQSLADEGEASEATAVQDTLNHVMQRAPRVFVDCEFCDMDYVRREVEFVNYVWDRKNAQVHVLVTSQRTGGGGREYTLIYIGQEKFAGKNDTLHYTSNETNTRYEVRENLTNTLKLGLIQYAARTPVSDYLLVNFTRDVEPQEIQNRWNNWVFRLELYSYFNGQETTASRYFNTSFGAEQITDNWKIRLNAYGSYDEDNFSIDGDDTNSLTRDWGSYGLVVRSISDHFSIGGSGRIYSSTYSNRALAAYVYPGIEYNIYPYSESSSRELRINYSIGPLYNDYIDTTLFNQTTELLGRQNLEISLDQTQPWGSLNISLDYANYLHDFTKNQISLRGNARIRVYKGLSLNLWGSYSFIHDQIYLPKSEASEEDIYLSRRALKTGFRYYGRLSVEYAFGAISNNIVNPRFGH